MAAYFLRRLLYAILTFFGITIATFALIHSVPGDPTIFYLGKAGKYGLSPAQLAHIRAEYHLDKPLPTQYAYWLRGIVTLDFGRSIVDRRRVSERILEKLPNTFELNAIAFLLAAAIGIPIGLWSATRSGRFGERSAALTFFLLYSLPQFWVALLLMQLFAVRLQILPLFGMSSGESASPFDHLRYLVLPVITLTYGQLAIFVRFSKSALTEVIRQDFITAARAKGAGEGRVLWQHAFRNALIPMITLLGLSIPYLISGSVIVEQIFQWDGIGLMYYGAILTRDYPTVMGLTVATAIVTLLASVFADILYAFADPRIRMGAQPR
jgi:peptide/nickel transport system permease protein